MLPSHAKTVYIFAFLQREKWVISPEHALQNTLQIAKHSDQFLYNQTFVMLQYVFDSIALLLLNRIWFDRGMRLVQEV